MLQQSQAAELKGVSWTFEEGERKRGKKGFCLVWMNGVRDWADSGRKGLVTPPICRLKHLSNKLYSLPDCTELFPAVPASYCTSLLLYGLTHSCTKIYSLPNTDLYWTRPLQYQPLYCTKHPTVPI